jgi:hypothetical protein
VNRDERFFCPDNRTLALQRRLCWKVDADVQDGGCGHGFFRAEQNTRPADIHGPGVNPVRHAAFAEAKWQGYLESLSTTRVKASGLCHRYFSINKIYRCIRSKLGD